MAGLKNLVKGAAKVAKGAAKEVKRKPGQFTLPKDTPKPKKSGGFALPNINKGGDQAMADKIFQHAEQVRSPDYQMVEKGVFGPADPALTKELVPQRSIADQLPPMPDMAKELPLNDRARQIVEATPEIGQAMAQDLMKRPDIDLPFYSTGSVLAGLEDRAGLRPGEALAHLGDWAGQGAATSPRTATPQNLRNASYLMYRRAQGNPLTSAAREAEGNRPGFAMMGMHTDLADEFATGSADPWKNPKPFTFQQNWTGNMADVTADTHNIRKTLDVFDRLNPGELHPGWFQGEDAYRRYQDAGGFPSEGGLPVGDINDRGGGAMIPGTGRKAQTEYPILQGPTREAARILGLDPAVAQERLWFEGGPRTGLRSPSMTIPDLLNSQFDQTGRVLGMDPEEIMKLWARKRIPLAEADVSDVPGASAVG